MKNNEDPPLKARVSPTMQKRKIGLFGGTFDPIHIGHLHLALTLAEAHHLDRVVFIPAARNPLKATRPAQDQDRLEMLGLALQDIGNFEIDPAELSAPPPSYTVDTVERWKNQVPPTEELYLLLGEDALDTLHLWKEPRKLFSMAQPLICARSSIQFPGVPHLPDLEKKLKEGWVTAPRMEVSATLIRKRLKEKRFCGHLLPAKVLDYINTNGLYSSCEKE